MSFLSKALSKVGIGAAKIDAVLDQTQVVPGQEVTGVLNITGGKVEQVINKIDLDVYSNYLVEEEYQEDGEDHTRIIEHDGRINSVDVEQNFTIGPGENKQIPFSFILNENAPLSLGKSTSWLHTNLDIDFALDKTDKDYLEVVPNELQAATLDAIIQLGFEMYDAECEGIHRDHDHLPFIQEFEFKAANGEFRGRLDELELVMQQNGDVLMVYLEIDRKARGLSGFIAHVFDNDETQVCFSVTEPDVEYIAATIYGLVDEHS